ncbi:GbpC/Spa domain-containing protein [Streptococcus sp. DD12]|uniref:GbpC/Spa domain-containing protein n=1 Tax=Streptococcus sp. DD12 TaxID=1777880 RepID=UPI000791FBA0|nr:GbpC/Spa domain-containing protein [Streptococcus sp. DD12]KXT76790.1 hypothetical protein STRDD12_00195 [Streptococcus sp. DD12]
MRSEKSYWLNRKAHFSLRKSKTAAGVASVLLGISFLAGPLVSADQVDSSQASSQTAVSSSEVPSTTSDNSATVASQTDVNLVPTDTQTSENGVTQTTQTVQTPDLTAAVEEAKATGLTVNQDAAQVKDTLDQAVADNAQQAKDIAAKTAQYKEDKDGYDQDVAWYNEEKAKSDARTAAYNQRVADLQNGDSQLVQDTVKALVQGQESQAQVNLTGVKNYITEDAVKRLGKDGILGQYATEQLTAADLTTSNPYSSGDNHWILMQVGDKVTATYTNLAAAKEGQVSLGRLVYTYTLLSSSNKAGSAIVSISNDPTVTATMGAETDSSDKALSMGVDLSFFDTKGNVIDLNDGYVILSVSSLNHWNGLANVSATDYPEAIELVANDDQGNPLSIGWGPYDNNDGYPAMKDGRPETRQLAMGDYFKLFGVTVSAENPVKIILPDGSVTDATQVTAGGRYSQENGHALVAASDQALQSYNGQSDVIGTYNLDPVTGVVTYTPAVRYDASNHIEKVIVGDKDTVATLPGSSIGYHDGALYAENDNEYVAKGATYNASQTDSDSQAWDSPSSPVKAYGSAGLVLHNGHLTFTASGNTPGVNTVYWFATNAAVMALTKPTPAPPAPTAPEVPTISYHDNQIIQNADNITATVHYTGAGDLTPKDNVQETNFSGQTGNDAVTIWSQNSHTFIPIATPIVPGYYASATTNPNQDPSIVPSVTVAVGDPDLLTTITYSKLGQLIPVDQDGNRIPGHDAQTYPNDPTDPTKIDDVIIPNIPGLTPYIDGQKVTPGTVYTPKYIGADTLVVYKNDHQEATVTFRDDSTGQQLGSVITLVGQSGQAIDFSSANQRLLDYLANGYDLVPNQIDLDGLQLRETAYDQDPGHRQDFIVRLIKEAAPEVTPSHDAVAEKEEVIDQTNQKPVVPQAQAVTPQAPATEQQGATLPQTGDQESAVKTSFIGSILMAMAGLMGIKLIRGRHGRGQDDN